MHVDDAGSERRARARAIHQLGIGRLDSPVNRSNAASVHQYVAVERNTPAAVKDGGIGEE